MNKALAILGAVCLTAALGAFDAQAKSGGDATGGPKPGQPCCASPNQKATGTTRRTRTIRPVKKPSTGFQPVDGRTGYQPVDGRR